MLLGGAGMGPAASHLAVATGMPGCVAGWAVIGWAASGTFKAGSKLTLWRAPAAAAWVHALPAPAAAAAPSASRGLPACSTHTYKSAKCVGHDTLTERVVSSRK